MKPDPGPVHRILGRRDHMGPAGAGLALLVMVLVAVRVGQVRLGWWAAPLFFLLTVQA